MAPAQHQCSCLSRNFLAGPRMPTLLDVEGVDGCVKGAVACPGVAEGLLGQTVGFEITPGQLNVDQFDRAFGQPFDREPMSPDGQRGCGRLADTDRPVVEDDHDRLGRHTRPRALEPGPLDLASRPRRHLVGAIADRHSKLRSRHCQRCLGPERNRLGATLVPRAATPPWAKPLHHKRTYPCRPGTPRRCAYLSSPRASTIRPVLNLPRHSRAHSPAREALPAAPHSPEQGICSL